MVVLSLHSCQCFPYISYAIFMAIQSPALSIVVKIEQHAGMEWVEESFISGNVMPGFRTKESCKKSVNCVHFA